MSLSETLEIFNDGRSSVILFLSDFGDNEVPRLATGTALSLGKGKNRVDRHPEA